MRELAHGLALWAALGLVAVPGVAAASDSNSDSDSGDSSDSGNSSDSGDSSDSGNSSDGTSQDSNSNTQSGDAGGAVVLTVISTVVAAAVITIVVVWAVTKDHGKERRRRAHAMLHGELIDERRDVGPMLVWLAESPSAMAQVDLEVAAGEGPELLALARALQVPPAHVVSAWTQARGELPGPATQAAAVAIVARFVGYLAPELAADPLQAGDLLYDLYQEQHADLRPKHRRVAAWMGVDESVVASALAQVFDDLPDGEGSVRGAVHAAALPLLDALADEVELRDPQGVARRLSWLHERAVAADPTGPLAAL